MWNPFAEPKYATGLREILPSRDVAQPGRALAWGARGRQFKSARPDHFLRSSNLQRTEKLKTNRCSTPRRSVSVERVLPEYLAMLVHSRPGCGERQLSS